MIDILKKTDLFAGLSDDEIESMLKCLRAKAVDYEKDEFIFFAGKTRPAVGIIIAGTAQVIKENYYGDLLIMHNLHETDMFGEVYAGMEADRVPVSVVALSPCRVLLLDLKNILGTCHSACSFHQRLILNLMKHVAEKSALLSEQMSYLSHKTIRARLEAYLHEQATKAGSHSFKIPFNKSELAQYLCVDRAAMQRELGKMKAEGLLSYDKNTFRLPKKA